MAFTALGAASVAGAVLNAAGVSIVDAPAPHDALAATPSTAMQLLVHNLAVALWPLTLVALGWPQIPVARRLGDVLVVGQLVGHGALVGSAVAQHAELWRYLPHLPFEWFALALPAARWLDARFNTPLSLRWLLADALAVAGLLTVAGLLETYAVPLP